MTKLRIRFGYTPEEFILFKKHAWKFLLLFSITYCCLYCTRLNLTNAGPLMIQDLGWKKADFGLLTATMFWVYGLGQLINGRLCELYGPRRFLFLGVLLSVLASIVFGFQTSLLMMTVIWGINSYAQSMVWPSGMIILTQWWPCNKRGFAAGFALTFAGFGQVVTTIAVLLAIIVLPQYGWRSSFFIPALFPFVALCAFVLIAKTSPTRVGLKPYKEEDTKKVEEEEKIKAILAQHGKFYPYKFLLKNKKFVLWLCVAFTIGITRYGLVSWIPLYFVDNFGINIKSGLIQSLALPIGMSVGTFVVPWLTDRYCPTNRLPAVAVSSICGTFLILAFAGLDPRIGWHMIGIQILLFTAGFCVYAIPGCVWAFAVDVGGRVFAGTAAGMLNFSQYMGAAVQSLLYGFLVDKMGWGFVFPSVAFFCFTVSVLSLIGSRKNKKDSK